MSVTLSSSLLPRSPRYGSPSSKYRCSFAQESEKSFAVGEETPRYGQACASAEAAEAVEPAEPAGMCDQGGGSGSEGGVLGDGVVPKANASEPSVLELDAVELHRRITGFRRLSEQARVEFLKLLAVFDGGRRYAELGYVNTRQYLMREFNMPRSSALEHLRAARALAELPKLGKALESGEISWSSFKAVSRVATSESEQKWLQLARDKPYAHTRQQVEQALATGRAEPSDRSDYGLSNIRAVVSCVMTLEEKERLQTALARVAEEMGEGAPTDLASVLIYLSQKILNGDLGLQGDRSGEATVSTVDGSDARSPQSSAAASGLVVVYRQCPDCALSTVDTEAGRVRVEPEVVDRIADVAEVTTITAKDLEEPQPLPAGDIDVPNSSAFARKIRHRDGLRCANPCCGQRRGLQAHHVKPRSEGGRTALCNEVAVCRACHTLIHSGLVKVTSTSPFGDELQWVPRIRELGQLPAYDPFPSWEEAQQAMGVKPEDVAAATSSAQQVAGDPRPENEPPENEPPENVKLKPLQFPRVDKAALRKGLQKLGYSKAEAESCIEGALQRLAVDAAPESITEEQCLRVVFRG